jgi:hypothetical protein
MKGVDPMSSDDEKIGYGKPPKKSQFTKGYSGNPSGRPKGSKSVNTIFRQIRNQKVRVTENGRTKTVTKLEAGLMQLANKAAGGDMRALKEVIALERIFAESEVIDIQTPDREKDEIVLRATLAWMERDNLLNQTADTSSELKQIVQKVDEDIHRE